MNTKVVVMIRGGMIQSIHSSDETIEAVIYDLDAPAFMTYEECEEFENKEKEWKNETAGMPAIY